MRGRVPAAAAALLTVLAVPASPSDAYGYDSPPHSLWFTLDAGPTFDFDNYLGTELGVCVNWFPLEDFLHLGATYRYSFGELIEPEGERLALHSVCGLVGYGSFAYPVAYYAGVMLGKTRIDGYFAGGELDEWVFTIGFYGDLFLPLGDVLGLNFHVCDQYVRGELGFYGYYTFALGLTLGL